MTQPAPLVLRGGNDERWRTADWQRLWLAIQERPWRSLALVPAGVGLPLDSMVHIAAALARTGMRHIGSQIHVADGTDLKLDDAAEFTAQLREAARNDLVIAALAPVPLNPVTVPIAQSVDGAVLCIVLDQMRMTDAKQTTEEIGHRHFVGAVTLR